MKKGFTLIELMVTIAIMGILFTIGYNSFRDYSRQQALITLARTLESDIKLAQQSAITGSKPVSGCTQLRMYQFHVVNSTRYRIRRICNGGNATIKTVILPSDTTISISPAANPAINFKPLAQGTNIPTGTTAIVTLTQTETGNTRSISIGSNGNVE